MSQHKIIEQSLQIDVRPAERNLHYTGYAGTLALRRVWHQLDVDAVLQESAIHYGKGKDKAPAMSFALAVGPLVEAGSIRRIAQRFGGEASQQRVEEDPLLSQIVRRHFDQRTLDRFVNTERFSWLRFQQALVRQLQRFTSTVAADGGVVIVDDFPIPKPYAEAMAYLSNIWDNNQQRLVRGYTVVHLYYHHPTRPDYSLYIEPWRKTSAMGETKQKPRRALRPARPGEQLSKMDMAHQALAEILPLLPACEAVLFDRWYTARWFGHALTEMGAAWIGECNSLQKFEVFGDYLSVPQIIERFQAEQIELPGLAGFAAVAMPALLRSDRYTKVDQAVLLVLLTRTIGAEEHTSLLICNRRQWSALKVVTLYRYRVTIEQCHRQGKQFAGWADFQTRSWPALQAHFAFALLRSLLLALLIAWSKPLQAFSLRRIIAFGIRCIGRIARRSREHITLYLPRGQPLVHACYDLSFEML